MVQYCPYQLTKLNVCRVHSHCKCQGCHTISHSLVNVIVCLSRGTVSESRRDVWLCHLADGMDSLQCMSPIGRNRRDSLFFALNELRFILRRSTQNCLQFHTLTGFLGKTLKQRPLSVLGYYGKYVLLWHGIIQRASSKLLLNPSWSVLELSWIFSFSNTHPHPGEPGANPCPTPARFAIFTMIQVQKNNNVRCGMKFPTF